MEDCKWLVVLDPDSEIGAVWRGSIVEELVEAGYSRGRAEQVVDNTTRWWAGRQQ